jgi:hypothetical protein
MQPRRRAQILHHIDRNGVLPSIAGPDDARELQQLGFIRGSYGDGRYQLTQKGAYAVVNAGPISERPSAGRVVRG